VEETRPLKFGRYRLDVLLGRGAMAEVHKAWDEGLRRWVAIKHLHSHGASDPEGRRALREARTAAQLGHPAIIRIFDVLEDDGGPGHTLLTRTAYEVARRAAVGEAAAGLQWLEHGRYRFRGIAEEVEVFEVGVPGAAPLRPPVGSEKVRPVATVEVATDVGESISTETRQPVVLRSWPPPELPVEPYPVLLPYTHPALLGGRDRDLDDLRMQLRAPVPILGLSAPSWAGKTSLLRAGLVPALRAEGKPVALIRHPHEAGVVGRLLGDLLEGGEPVDDHDWRGFVERLCEVERLAGEAPLLVLDQFEDVLRRVDAAPERAGLGVLLAATVRRRPGRPAPPCGWLLAYRREYHGEVAAWLGDVLADARAQQLAGIDGLPHDLASPDRFQAQALAPLGSPLAGTDPVTAAAEKFLAAIEAPLALRAADGSPEDPLTPELQVVLAHLMARAGESFVIEVPEDSGDLIDEALADHLGRALEAAFPAAGHNSGAADSRPAGRVPCWRCASSRPRPASVTRVGRRRSWHGRSARTASVSWKSSPRP